MDYDWKKKEIDELNRLYNSNKAELVAVFGRRRVGKTYLINHFLKMILYLNIQVYHQKMIQKIYN